VTGPVAPKKLPLARRMRKAPAATEDFLWRLLRDRRLDGLKFRRQVPIGRYVADFVCFRHRLIVEADGPFHQDSTSDAERDAWLKQQGFRVLRFTNSEIHADRDRVLDDVLTAAGRNV
jgi:very-short-patch-repair endonuclease